MHYSNFLNKGYLWKTVNVRQDDGPLHYGRIIDCADEGLTIDFGCKDVIGPQVVPFGRIHHIIDHVYDYNITGDCLNKPVEALVRLNPTEPAKWYPATLLESTSSDSALIKIVTRAGAVLDIIGGGRIRHPRNDEMLYGSLVEKGDFMKEVVELPSGFSTGFPSPGPYKSDDIGQLVVEAFNKNCKGNWMYATHVDGNILHILKITTQFRRKFDRNHYRGSCPKLEGDSLRRLLGMAPPLPMQANQMRSDSQSKLLFDTKKRLQDVCGSSHVCGADVCVRVFPSHLLAEVFRSLDGMEQAKCRRVCVNWNFLLTAAEIRSVLSLPKQSSAHPLLPHQPTVNPYVCLLKSWNHNTNIIIITTGKNLRSCLEDTDVDFAGETCSGRVFRCLKDECHLGALEVMFLANISWLRIPSVLPGTGHFDFAGVIQGICDELNMFAGVCRTLVLKDVTVAWMGWKGIEVIIHISNGRIVGNLRVEDFWSKMDDSLPAVTDGDSARLMECITDRDLDRDLLNILNERQSYDPRDDNQCRGVSWNANDLASLDFGKLSKFTVHSMLKAASFEKFVVRLMF